MVSMILFVQGSPGGDEEQGPEDAKPKKKMKKKMATKKTDKVQDLSMFDEDAPNIFDDPLSALGTS